MKTEPVPSRSASRLVLGAALIVLQTFILAARPVTPVQGGLGVIDGTVVQADSGLPISNAQVTLSGGGIKPQSIEKLSQQLMESTFMPPEITTAGVRGYYANTRGLPQPEVQEAVAKMMTEGAAPSPESGALEDGILQSIMRNANVNLGTSPFNSEFVSAANAQFKIKGTLTVNGTLPAGLDLARLRITPTADNRMVSELIGFVGAARSTTAPDGTLTISVPAGMRVRLGLGALPQGLYIADVLQGGTSVYDSGFEARAEASSVQVMVNTDGATIKGSLQDSAGKPLSGGVVALVPAEARRQNRGLYRSAGTDAAGRLTMSSVPPGEYKLFPWGPGLPTGSFYNPVFLARYEDRGRPITVAPSATMETEPMRVPVD